MPGGSVPPTVRRFVAQWVQSIEQLEILCLLGTTPQQSWSTRDVLTRIQSSEKSISENLQRFAQGGILEAESGGRYRYAPKRPELSEAIAQLVTVYRERRVSLITAIYSGRSVVEPNRLPSAGSNPATGEGDSGSS